MVGGNWFSALTLPFAVSTQTTPSFSCPYPFELLLNMHGTVNKLVNTLGFIEGISSQEKITYFVAVLKGRIRSHLVLVLVV